jgi:sulfur-carrier protein adenylyltransferase/sulfurtransferase
MKWKQFLTPVTSMDSDEARVFIGDKSSDELMILDVRQSGEYEKGHIPGAKLIPLPDLDSRLSELDKGKPTVVYCAIGGRSRAAAQLLAGKGFDNIINLSGGIRAWNGQVASGSELQGLNLFSGDQLPESALAVAYSLENGLMDFYLKMADRVSNDSAKNLFKTLSDIEVKHQDRIYREYESTTENPLSREDFVNLKVSSAIEGGLTTEEFAAMFNPDWESVRDITEIAMSIEAQSLDLYMRMSEKGAESRNVFKKLADEERLHLKELGKLLDSL